MKTERFEYMDSVRGIACMIVVFLHICMVIYPDIHVGKYATESLGFKNILLYPPFSILFAGQASVCLFFILSGYVLSYNFISPNTLKIKIIEAIIKRPIRLSGVIIFSMLPMYYFLITKEFWTTKLWIDYDIYAKMFANIFNGYIYSSNMYYYNPPMWTISIELYGSFLTFISCLILCDINKYIRMILLASLFFALINTYYCAFVFGIIISDLCRNYKYEWFINNKNTISKIIIIPSVFIFSYPYYFNEFLISNISFINSGYAMIGAMLIFICVMCSDFIKISLNNKILVFIGKISYSIYIIHFLLIERYCVYLYSKTNFITCLIIMLLIIITASYLIDKFIDSPCIKLSTRISKELIIKAYSFINFKLIHIPVKCASRPTAAQNRKNIGGY